MEVMLSRKWWLEEHSSFETLGAIISFEESKQNPSVFRPTARSSTKDSFNGSIEKGDAVDGKFYCSASIKYRY